MADFSKAPESKNIEDRTRGGFRGFLDSMNEAFGTGRHSKEFKADQLIHQAILNATRMAPITKMAAERHAQNVKENPSIPADLDLDIIVDNWIRKAREETTPYVNFESKK